MNFKLGLLTASCLLAFTQLALAEAVEPQSSEADLPEEQSVEHTKVSAKQEQAETSAKAEALVDLEVKGIKKKDKDAWANVKIYLGQIAKEYADGSERHQYLVQTAVDKALRAKGYYNTQYQFIQTPRAGKKPLLTLNVELDRQKVKIDETDVHIMGEAGKDEEFTKLIDSVPKKGTNLDHEQYDGFKSNLESLAFKKGYFDGHWLYHRLEIYPKEHSADWRLGYDSGIRYRYGEITFTDNQIKEEYLQNILKVKSGEPYYANDLSQMTSDYSSSDWFSSVLVEPHLNEKEKVVDLNVLFQPKKKNDVEVGIGFATDVGPRFQLNWKKPWINSRGHSIESRTYISAPEQRFEFGYNIPLREDPLHYYYQFSGSLENEDQNDTKSTAATVGFQRFWTHETGWSFSAGVKARYDSFTQANESHRTLLVYPTASLNRTRSDGNRFPLWGDSQKLTVNWGAKALASDVNFYSWKASSAWVRTYFDHHRFFLRGEVGHIHSNDFYRIPPALRYFAGGDMSVRGFGYKDISPRDPQNGKLLGASHLATATVEYQYQVYPDWWTALFYDTGLASNKFKAKDLHSGAGLGVRWASPIGAIKFDLATPVRSPNNEKGVQFYIGLGSEL
ncbi:autotransporter assembly complex protein TamA [Actinobacillus equuli subsp. haemolyticus]|uniref:autotransporter assembly complex protein TamA n=1 Tax=Actinobacillus equuli TaxID=718 RepID=UPI0024435BA8|nr:autotransporter assembly complex protein TamA [Actinobacillus equuli]WGE64110.1 autotransporter assembly complex protein TamA [Actinobacillus equuli subsp. haemolyticus]